MSSQAEYRYTVIVIPTRNRSDIAKNAIRSVIEQPNCDVRVLVSDNSTQPQQIQDLKQFCEALQDPRLHYVRPPAALSMAAHWDWAIAHALQAYDASHFLYLTDRMMFKPLELEGVLDRAAVYPDKIVSYNHDRIVDDKTPIRIEQQVHTGKLLEIKTLRLSYLYAQSIFHHGFPRMLNCIVPRAVFNRIHARFGNIFTSIAPDFLFCCRCIEMEDSILYYDRSPIFHYALNRSHGASVTRGEMTPANIDFTANLPVDNSIRNYATPIPQLITATNAIFNEYLIFKNETQSSRFFEIDLQQYLRVNAEEISEVVDTNLRAEMLALLETGGLKETNGRRSQYVSVDGLSRVLSPTSVWKRVQSKLKTKMTGPATKPFWLFLARRFGINPPDDNGFAFSKLDDAIHYLEEFPRASWKEWPRQDELIQARPLPFRNET